MRRLAILVICLTALACAAEETKPARSYCVWPAVGGAVGGVMVGWYGYVGVAFALGKDPFAIGDTPLGIAATLGLEGLSLVGGATAACAIWGNEGRWFPAAGSVITGGMLGGAVFGASAFSLLRVVRVEAPTDFPVVSGMVLFGSILAGTIGGGVMGYWFDNALRGPPGVEVTIAPAITPESTGAMLLMRF